LIQTKTKSTESNVVLTVDVVSQAEKSGETVDQAIQRLEKRVAALLSLRLRSKWAVAELEVSYKNDEKISVSVDRAGLAYNVFLEMWDKSLINLQEQFCALFLNRAKEVIGFRLINTGSAKRSTIDINTLCGIALVCHAQEVIIAHNHPSGQLKPSHADVIMTLEIQQALKMFDIDLIDSLIITETGYYSLTENKKLHIPVEW
jgi:DNA repair protein RadC